MSKISVVINGANGKMGKTAVAAIAHEKDLTLVATTSRDDDLMSVIQKHRADVVIDFTTPHAIFENTKKIIDAGARPVIGTTGLSSEQIQWLMDCCADKKRGAIIAPNFSIGALLMMRYAKDAAKYFPDAEIIEYHHPKKLDAPSGTAKKTAELIGKTLPIHSVRLPCIFAEQEVIFSAAGERLIIRHAATDRNAMMPGLFLCCRKVMILNHLIYGMETLI